MIESNKLQKTKSSQSKGNIKKDFKQFFIESSGTAVIKQAEFEEVSSPQSSQDGGDFQEDDEEVEVKGMKTYQFWSGIKFPKDAPKPTEDPVQWEIKCPFSFGFNSLGRDNIIYIDGKICKAVGCLLIFNNDIICTHNKKITTLAYNPQTCELLSATQSPSPQLFLWQYDSQCQDLEFVRRFSIGLKSENIYSVSLFCENYVVAVQIFTLHKSSNLHCFSKEDGKKICSLKVGKFYDMQVVNFRRQEDQDSDSDHQSSEDKGSKQRLFFANDQGIFEFVQQIESSNKIVFKTIKIHESQNVCCLLPFYDGKNLQIIYGDKQGNLNLVFAKFSIKVHQGWIFELKGHIHNEKNYFFALGAMDLQLSVIEYQSKKLKVLRKVLLNGYGRSIQSQNDLLLVGKRYGDYDQFSLRQLIQQKNDSKITRKETPSLRCFQTKQMRKQFFFEAIQKNKVKEKSVANDEYNAKNFIYGHSKSKSITFFTILGQNLKDIKPYGLRYYPEALHSCQNLLAYIYCVDKDENAQSSSIEFKKTSSKFLQKTLVKRMILVVEDIVNKNSLVKIPLQFQSQLKKQSLIVSVKFSPLGNFLAISDQQCNVYIIPIGKGMQSSQKLTKQQKKSHKQAIKQIIWSKDEKYIKTISTTELYYWEIVRSQEAKGNGDIKLKNSKPSQVSQIIWSELGKFGWETKNVWENTDFVEDISKFWEQEYTSISIVQKKTTKQVSSFKEKFVGCIKNDGNLRIYNYPSSSKKQEIRLNDKSFLICPISSEQTKFSFLVLIEGILLVLELNK